MTQKWLNILEICIFVIFVIYLMEIINRIPETPFISERTHDYIIAGAMVVYGVIYTIGLIRHRDPANKIGCLLKFYYIVSIIMAIGLILELFI